MKTDFGDTVMILMGFVLLLTVALILCGCSSSGEPKRGEEGEKSESGKMEEKEEEPELTVSEAGQKEMLRLARDALRVAATLNQKTPHIGVKSLIKDTKKRVLEGYEPPDELKMKRGIFVTLRKDDSLRGCIGTFRADKPLFELAVEFAVNSGFGDPRFTRLAPNELPSVNIEISVLSPLRRVKSPEEVIVGKHGIEVVRGWRSGCFLPEVATDYNMDREEFLSTCCSNKAGLPPDAWKDPDTEIYVFTTFKFKEK